MSTTNPLYIKANRLIDTVLIELDKQDVFFDLSEGKQPTVKPNEGSLGAIRSSMASYVMHTREHKLPVNRTVTLRMIRATLKWIGMEHYEEFLWTPGLERKRDKAASAS